ncbi:MAG: hypothetical protein ACYDAR_11190 [Thermomicrobiales bacterium]
MSAMISGRHVSSCTAKSGVARSKCKHAAVETGPSGLCGVGGL